MLLLLAGCGGGAGDADGKTLEVWHYEAPNSAMGVAWREAIKEFEASHPGVKVRFQEKGFEQIQKTAPMVLNSREAPDVLEYNKGNATTGLLARQGLLTDLTEEVTRRGWDKVLAPGLQTTARYDDKGVMGSGKWFGVPNYAEYVTVYYNKDAFAQRGLSVPTTLAEFTAAMDAFVAAGITPLAVGGAEYPAQQILYQLALSKADRGWVDRFQRYTGPVDFHDAAWTYGAETFAEWVRKGYLSSKSAGVKAEDMGAAFTRGEHPIMISGSWWHGRLAKEVSAFQWGTFRWPGNALNAGSAGNHWVVPQGSKNKQLAYDFIDITMRKSIQHKLAEVGAIAVGADPAASSDPRITALTEDFTALVRADGLAFYPDWPAPGYYDTMVSATQKLITGSASPYQVLDELAKPYRENLAAVGR
ncbi:raffinose/stachyose/melibiose transport system substrate-binding protein [Crossiella equi]|uniref:Raffinose/stachyose/melibiose transport system substrate-binding protein n=1 Tax=Crossiella equi TaxID=130796 RepID=A0ABS5ASQ6_9PSEU|nr:extracellular solute-binding protein [Crossiella equi]MBP2479599.1 raffinose/stachyose/melibiose transport system substrate-binding protein [Crossiella equi]